MYSDWMRASCNVAACQPVSSTLATQRKIGEQRIQAWGSECRADEFRGLGWTDVQRNVTNRAGAAQVCPLMALTPLLTRTMGVQRG